MTLRRGSTGVGVIWGCRATRVDVYVRRAFFIVGVCVGVMVRRTRRVFVGVSVGVTVVVLLSVSVSVTMLLIGVITGSVASMSDCADATGVSVVTDGVNVSTI
jgi:hypothetical protein